MVGRRQPGPAADRDGSARARSGPPAPHVRDAVRGVQPARFGVCAGAGRARRHRRRLLCCGSRRPARHLPGAAAEAADLHGAWILPGDPKARRGAGPAAGGPQSVPGDPHPLGPRQSLAVGVPARGVAQSAGRHGRLARERRRGVEPTDADALRSPGGDGLPALAQGGLG